MCWGNGEWGVYVMPLARTCIIVTELVSHSDMPEGVDVLRNIPCINTRCERKRTAEWACEQQGRGSLLTTNASATLHP